ncbi:MAG TPA: VapC toxin family PIN domain ribonuclease [Cyanobacteria bacterium UBA11369]|nr:VapC toxin family PIN domain ribonuclease [Cyanobacteria bacterium UBA11371]HBE47434.1 VapC toxin family PIN domain ribonuclease [Cyanobacteria bacterium UBA11369]
MSGSFLLDTNIAIAFLEGELAIVDRVTQTDSVLLSSTIVGELYYGAFKSGRVTSNIERVEVLVQRIPVLDCDRNTAKVYGQIKHQLRQKGRPLPENDIWIAAIAQQYDLTLVSRDRHFQEIENLKLEIW